MNNILSQAFGKKLDRTSVRSDLIAGITVALILIPQSLAYAQLAGLPPHYGLYASFLPPIIGALFGSSHHLSTGPTAVISIMTSTALSPLAISGSSEFIAYAILLAFLLGLFQILLGVLKIGELVNFLSHPVIYGFTNAAAIIIVTSQFAKLFGVNVPHFEHHFQTVVAVASEAIRHTHIPTFLFGAFSLVIMYVVRRFNSRLPSVLLILVVTTLISQVYKYDGAIVGSVPQGIASVSLPVFDLSAVIRLIFPVIIIALIGFTESVSVAQAIAVKTKQRLDPNKELLGQGLANLVGSFYQSFPVAGSFSRTAVNFQAGAKSGLASVFTGIVTLISLLFFTKYLYFLPQVVLAAIIILSVTGLIDFAKFKHIWFTNKFDGYAALLTFFGTLLFAPDLEKGVFLGVIFSISHYLYQSVHPKVVFLSRYKDGSFHDAERYKLDRCQNIAAVRLDAPLFFANATFFENEIIKDLSVHPQINDILIVANGINEIDATGELMLSSLVHTLKSSKKNLYFSYIKSSVREVLQKTGLWNEIGEDHVFHTTKEAVEHILEHVNHNHQDEDHCPLMAHIDAPIEAFITKDRRETIAYYYKKIFRS